ncbi:hypothetical protein AA101099_1535 [Neoasaia chiangmaiensis NBRC 101099]|uniref:Glycine-rich domain-containing protein n=1 Tax=Neoasaia chiangmaiensis TaxID=320497 RepID=A0A1U9KQA0_9PROT|nr:hypothetical protein [Neoasaia chiangmaiensis]AQS87900.1 hypothetical protein A0U93_08055 [Neoasaia chiangmaiensis]GBR39146.1 hypothetical protein AA101099_1535 [Neoasaia chiangmaiensis NBRC 101099]GEN15547.1 hypothetical protein NCH01_19780 [Neoasaia chiangmaiensis]
MDRAIVYAGAIPMDTDMLRVGRYVKDGLGRLAEMLFGVGAMAASGLDCSVSSTGLSVTIGAGSILAPGVMDAADIGGAGGGLPADPTAIAVQYVNDAPQVVSMPAAGVTCTIYALCAESDVDETVLPFFNVDDPDRTLAGLGNNGAGLPTRRQGGMQFVAATAPPAAPAGGTVVPLYTLTILANARSLAGVVPVPGKVFWPTIPELATLTTLRAATAPMALMDVGGTLNVPAWASRVELRAIGGGGGGSTSNAATPTGGSFSGSGGGSGGDAWGVYDVSAATPGGLDVTVGAGGAALATGGTTLVSYGGQTLLQAAGGAPGSFFSSQGSAGGGGGAASGGTIWNLSGGWGGDGQSGESTFAGYGADGPWGGGGRCGADAGMPATKYGAGGGGAYAVSATGAVSPGGAGYRGCVLYRFLP